MQGFLGNSNRDEPCDLCDDREFDLVARHDRRGGRLRTVVCRRCGLLSHEQVPSDAELTSYYAHQYRHEYHGEYTPSAYRVLREWKRAKQLVQLLSDQLKFDDRIVEIGSGIGCTVKNLACAGFDAGGIEPGDGFRQFANNALRVHIMGGTLADLPRIPAYDVILLVHVLEHLRSPTEALTHIRALLRPEGRLYLEVPNAGAPHALPRKMFHFAHVYNFTPDTLKMFADKTGFLVSDWFGAPEDRNLRVLLRECDNNRWTVQPASYARTLDALARYSPLTYHLRWRYLRERVATIVRHGSDRVLAARRLRTLLHACQNHGQANTNWPEKSRRLAG